MQLNVPKFCHQPSILRASFHINTPMFAAGSQQSKAELTPTAFKGLLRFWWRALNWSHIFLASHQNKEKALKELHKKEGAVFGLAAEKGSQSRCLVNAVDFKSITANTEKENIKKWQYANNKQGINYLLGQGLYHYKKGLNRNALTPQQTFNITLTVSSEHETQIVDALKLMGLLGGFGSRSRHGFGSVTLIDIYKRSFAGNNEFISLKIDVSNAVKSLRTLLKNYECRKNQVEPPLSAFYAKTRIDVVPFDDVDAINLLNKVGEELQLYRSWGKKDKNDIYTINGIETGTRAEQNFRSDHDMMKTYIHTIPSNLTHPKRVIFGLPHAYIYSDGSKIKVDASLISPNKKIKTRRSSPLIQHIHKTTNNQYQLIHCLFQSEFLPKNGKIFIKDTIINPQIDWQTITNFMNRSKFANKITLRIEDDRE